MTDYIPIPKFKAVVSGPEDCGHAYGIAVAFEDSANANLLLRNAVFVKVGDSPEEVADKLDSLSGWIRNRVRERYVELKKEHS